jgi:hypothetical protein
VEQGHGMKVVLAVLAAAAMVAAPASASAPLHLASALQVTSGAQAGSCYLVAQTAAAGPSGSVARALVETMSRELEVLYGFIQQVYDSAFISTDGGDLTATLTLVDLAASPIVLAQADLSVHDPGLGKLAVESVIRGQEQQQLPELEACVRVRLHEGTRFDRD